jgi:NAD+ diphosphatase
MHGGKVLIKADSETPKLNLMPVDQVPTANLRAYLGKTTSATSYEANGAAIVLAIVNENSANQIEPDGSKWIGLRSLGAELSDRDAGLFTQALALYNWHENNVHCPKCGTPTVIEQGGWARRCFKDNNEIFPRTDPAIIVAITDQQDRILLGSQGTWEHNRWSVLAGFVEAGESLEAAVVREMKEECGLEVFDIQYLYSQSWPFPQSLMLGFRAQLADGQDANAIMADGEEIRSLRWFTREELTTAAETDSIKLPGPVSIARHLLEDWLGASISQEDTWLGKR